MKKRVFIVNDASFLNTGYSIYGKEILTRLHKNPNFEVAELGCYCDISNPKIKNIPWKFYPNAVSSNDQRNNEYKANTLNGFGLWRFNRCVADFRPHIVFDIRDYWMFAYQENSPFKKYFHWVVMPATDSSPPKVEWLYTYNNADVVIPYTDWAKKVLSEHCGSQINLFPKIANAGINPEEFYPLEDKKQHKINYLGGDFSVVGLVMRNQKRKLFPDIMLAYKKYLERLKSSSQTELYQKSYLYLHTSYPEPSGWDIPGLLLEYGLLDKTLLTYVCRECKEFFPSKFQGTIVKCRHCNNGTATIASSYIGVDTKQLNQIYNFFDLFIQYAICEGFGMPQIEAAACGIPIASVDYSAMTEIVSKLDGYAIPVNRIFRELETNADRAYPDIDATTDIIYNFFIGTTEEQRKNKSLVTREKCISYYTWDNVYAVWEECFNSIDITKKLSWSSQNTPPSHKSIKVPKNLSNTDFVKYICCNVLNDRDLLKTANLQSLIKDLCNGIIARDGNMTMFNKNQAISILESYLNNQISCEKMRLEPQSIPKEDFIQ